MDPRNSRGTDPLGGVQQVAELRTELHRLRTQLALVEVLYLRLIALQARRLADPELERELGPEVLRLEDELARARDELRIRETALARLTPPDSGPHAN